MISESFLVFNIFFLVPVILINGLIQLIFYYKFKLRNRWNLFDWIFLLFPGIIYSILYDLRIHQLITGDGKSLANIVEIYIMILLSVIFFLLKKIMTKNKPSDAKKYSIIIMTVMLLITIIIEIFFPGLQE
jgi:hypothetical protein